MNVKTAVQVSVLIGVFAVGAITGGVVVFQRTVRPMVGILEHTRVSYLGQEAYVRYRFGSYGVAKAALLRLADEIRDSGRVATVDLGLTYGRLAIAAERASEIQDASEYMKLAVKMLSISDGETTADQVRDTIERLDSDWDRQMSGSNVSLDAQASNNPGEANSRYAFRF